MLIAKKLCFIFILGLTVLTSDLLGSVNYSGAEIIGTIIDRESQEPMIGVVVSLTNAVNQYQALTDDEGVYRIKPIEAGTYKLVTSYAFYQDYTVEDITVGIGQTLLLDLKLSEEMEIIVVTYKNALLDPFDPSSVKIDPEIIKKAPTNRLEDVIGPLPGVFQDDVGRIQIRGSRVGNVQYLVDGVKVNSLSGIPMRSVNSMQVFTGGIPAKYGDTTGGVVVVSTMSYGDKR